MYVQEEVRKLESAETRNKELQIRTEEAGRMRKEIARLEKENAMLRCRARDDESAHEEMLGVVQSLYSDTMGLIEENSQIRSNGATKRSVSPSFNPEKRKKNMTDIFNQLAYLITRNKTPVFPPGHQASMSIKAPPTPSSLNQSLAVSRQHTQGFGGLNTSSHLPPAFTAHNFIDDSLLSVAQTHQINNPLDEPTASGPAKPTSFSNMLFKYNVNQKREKTAKNHPNSVSGAPLGNTEVKVLPPQLPPRDNEESFEEESEEDGNGMVRVPKRAGRHARSGSRNDNHSGYQGQRRT